MQHARTLGLAPKAPSKAAIRKAFRSEAKLWHPDRYEKEPVKRLEAEEHFKVIQVAYRELWEHCENPVETRAEPVVSQAPTPKVEPEEPAIFFGDARGCYAPPNIPLYAQMAIVDHLEQREKVLGFVDLSGKGAVGRSLSGYILLTSDRVFVRDAMNLVSLIWYTDLGEIRLVDLHKDGKPGIWQRMVEYFSETERRYSLQIERSNGTLFCAITGQVDDSVKKVIYNFLQQKKSKPRF